MFRYIQLISIFNLASYDQSRQTAKLDHILLLSSWSYKEHLHVLEISAYLTSNAIVYDWAAVSDRTDSVLLINL